MKKYSFSRIPNEKTSRRLSDKFDKLKQEFEPEQIILNINSERMPNRTNISIQKPHETNHGFERYATEPDLEPETIELKPKYLPNQNKFRIKNAEKSIIKHKRRQKCYESKEIKELEQNLYCRNEELCGWGQSTLTNFI